MYRKIKIKGYKSISDQEIELKPLTILTGINSTGKSSVIQSILLISKLLSIKGQIHLNNIEDNFNLLKNRYENSNEVLIELTADINKYNISLRNNQDSSVNLIKEYSSEISFEDDLYYLSANRIGAEELAKSNPKIKIGTSGDYIFGTYEAEKSNSIKIDHPNDESESYTLSYQLNKWLSKILDIKLEVKTEATTTNTVLVKYKSDGLDNISPFQLGTGVSYLAKILIMCLRAKKGDVLMIENPEIHLHPKAQSKLGEFFTYIINSGIQLIIETHCEHLINRIQYEVYKKNLPYTDSIIWYKGGIQSPFQKIEFDNNGDFTEDFPEGFFDVSVDYLMEMI